MHNQLLDHPSFAMTQEIKALCRPLDAYNLSTFAHARVNSKGGFSSLNNHPEFMAHYLKQNYHCADISAKEEYSDIGHYLMWDIVKCHGATANMLADAAAFNYRHIFTVIEKQEDHTDFYHFGTHIDNPAINQWYLNNLDKLRQFIDAFKDQVSQSRELSKAHLMTYPVLQPGLCQMNLDLNSLEQRDTTQQPIHHEFPSQLTLETLSPRQIQCLRLLLKGCRTKEMAKQLGLSCRTVDDHLTALKNKLQAKNKSELIIKAALLQTW